MTPQLFRRQMVQNFEIIESPQSDSESILNRTNFTDQVNMVHKPLPQTLSTDFGAISEVAYYF